MLEIKSLLKMNFKNPASFFLFSAIVIFVLLIFIDCFDNKFSWHDIKVEAHGLFYDLIIFGILLSLYDKVKSKSERIQRLKDEINDYKGWYENEAKHRIVGNIKRLIEEGERKLSLNDTF
ncbi:MAG: hypothetical protein IPO86_12855 [Saprospiraceae bacterium]|nr:hypothetical protein [Saprospiraceae bacterium]MBK9728997.1 hypothetical protein [Saprospiraceae bacterium]